MAKTKRKKEKNVVRKETGFAPHTYIKVIGVGGGGGNAVSRMQSGIGRGVEFIAVNTDHQDLDHCEVRHKVYVGKNLTNGMGTGMNPELGRQAAEENRSEIGEALQGADMVFIAAGLGGGTGSGASPVIAEVAKQNGALTIAFVTKPFAFEGSERERIAQESLAKLREKVDALIVVSNDRIFTVIDKETPLLKAFEKIDDILKAALEGIVDMIVMPGIVNVDFADIRAIIRDAGSAIVGVGIASGEERAVEAVKQALHSPLLEASPEGAQGIVLGISGRDVRMTEINEAARIVTQIADPSARVIFGAYHDRRMEPKKIKVTLIATSFNNAHPSHSLFGPTSLSEIGERGSGVRKTEETPKMKTEDVDEEGSKKERNEEKIPIDVEDFFPKGKDKKGGLSSEKKKESDIWDIPTFLRRRKKR